MNMLRFSCGVIAIVGFTLAHADNPSASARNAPAIETEQEGWALRAQGESSILTQARAVFAALRGNGSISGAATAAVAQRTVDVANLDVAAEEIRDGNGSEGCLFMEIPGSRIKERRCYYPSEAEKRLNAYQFADEIQYNRDLQAIIEMQQMEALGIQHNLRSQQR